MLIFEMLVASEQQGETKIEYTIDKHQRFCG